MNTENPPAVLEALLTFDDFRGFWDDLDEAPRIAMVQAMRRHTQVYNEHDVERRHFAGLAMQGMISNEFMMQAADAAMVPTAAVEMADALIEQLNKSK